ncbi:MAG: flagellar hook assembly protein FlgD [Gammaproteobacteria bacterium]|nr:flagellar hook assembly protein FlgD [Gammaproteobacteria bacterium]
MTITTNNVPGTYSNPATTGAGTATTGTSATGGAANATTLGGTDFLTLMLAQLKNQDPTSPIDSNTFLTQLAQLSEVQGITQLNTSFSGLSNSLVSNQALQASSLLGHQALVPSSTASLQSAGATVTGAVQVPQTTSDVVLNVSDASGVLVRQIDLGAQAAGLANFSWDGKLADGSQAPAGAYALSAQVAGVASGTAVSTYVNGTVQSVTMGAGASGLTLDVAGQGSVPFANVQQISN